MGETYKIRLNLTAWNCTQANPKTKSPDKNQLSGLLYAKPMECFKLFIIGITKIHQEITQQFVEFRGFFKIGHMTRIVDDMKHGTFDVFIHEFGFVQWRYGIFPATNNQGGNANFVQKRAGFRTFGKRCQSLDDNMLGIRKHDTSQLLDQFRFVG